MNIKSLAAWSVFPLVVLAGAQFFAEQAKLLGRKTSLGAVGERAIETSRTLNRTDFSILKVTPDQAAAGSDIERFAQGLRRSPNTLILQVGENTNTALGERIRALRNELEQAQTSPTGAKSAGIVTVAVAAYCDDLRLGGVADDGAFINGRFRTTGESFLHNSVSVSLTRVDIDHRGATVNCGGRTKEL